MKKLIGIVLIVAVACGCTSTHIKADGKGGWEARVNSHWFAKDVDRINVAVSEGGKFTAEMNGYKGDVSEKLPLWTAEMWTGLGVIARLAATAYNPAASGVPLTTEAENDKADGSGAL